MPNVQEMYGFGKLFSPTQVASDKYHIYHYNQHIVKKTKTKKTAMIHSAHSMYATFKF